MALGTNQVGVLGQKNWLLWAAAIVIAVVLLASFMSRGEVIPVRAATLGRSTIRSIVSTNGKVEPIQSFEAHAPVGTTVKRLAVREGQRVKKGQLLAQLEDADASSQAARAMAQVRAAQAEMSAVQGGGNHEEILTLESQLGKARTGRDTAQRNLEALQRLQQNGAASPGEVKQAQDQLAAAESDLKLLQQKQRSRYSAFEVARVEAQKVEAESAYAAAESVLRQLNIRAPFEGIVYSLPVHQGSYVNPGDLVLQEADLSKVLVRAYVDEPDVGRLATGQPIELTWDAIPGRTWQGAVTTIPSTVKLLGTRNVGETTCVVDNQDLKLLPNINVGVTIVTAEHRNALTVPREAVRLDDNKKFVFQIVNDELQRRDIQTSISNLTEVEVTSGVSDNALLALASTSSKPLRDRAAIKIVH